MYASLSVIIDMKRRKTPSLDQTGFYIVAHSQGGLVARGLLFECKDIAPLVKGIVTIGTPNMGIDNISENIKAKMVDENVPWIIRMGIGLHAHVNDGTTPGWFIVPFQYTNVLKEVLIDSHLVHEKRYSDKGPPSTNTYLKFIQGFVTMKPKPVKFGFWIISSKNWMKNSKMVLYTRTLSFLWRS